MEDANSEDEESQCEEIRNITQKEKYYRTKTITAASK